MKTSKTIKHLALLKSSSSHIIRDRYWRTIILIGLIFTFQMFWGCKDKVTSPPSLDNLHVSFVSGFIGADLMPIIEPDPIDCRIIIVAENSSRTDVLNNLTVGQADVFLNSNNQRLGTIKFSTSWDGRLNPLERDTISLTKVVEQTSPFSPQCNKTVYINLVIQNGEKSFVTIKTDSIGFTCVY
ncbi:MAG: hypothetical protein M0P61_14650 [Ignavibacteriaceae bacterium]|nr:hypothetical protein [Ignavibacteriaceae bacterium]